MTDLLTRFDIAIHDRVERLQSRLHAIKNGIAPEGSAIDRGADAIEETIDTSRKKLANAYETLDDWVDVKLDQVYAWRETREVDHLIKQSEKSQRHAEAALDVALGALDEAELALAKATIAENSARELAPPQQDKPET